MPRLRKLTYKQKCQKRKQVAATRREEETPEQRAVRLEKTRIRAAVRRACENEEERSNRLARERTRIYTVRARLKQKARAFNLQQINQHSAAACEPEKITTRSDSNKHAQAQSTAYNAYITLKVQREVAAKNAAIRRSQETPEQRATRLEKSRLRAAFVRSCEGEEKRAVRLSRQRIRTNAARAYMKFKTNRDALLKFRQETIANSNDQSRPTVGVDDFKHLHKETPANNIWERARTIQLQHIYQQHIAFQACLLLDAQRRGIDFSLPGHSGGSISEWQRFPAYYNLPDRTSEKEDEEMCGENDSSESLAIANVECEVTIEEGDELEDSKRFLEQYPHEESKDGTDFVRENLPNTKKDTDSKPALENMFETVYCEPLGLKEEIPEKEYCEDEVSALGKMAADVPSSLSKSSVQHPEPVPSLCTLKPVDELGCLNEVVTTRAEASAVLS